MTLKKIGNERETSQWTWTCISRKYLSDEEEKKKTEKWSEFRSLYQKV